MTSQIKISVIIPLFNVALTIRQCLQSLLRQNYPKNRFEIIVIHNGSTDATPQIIKKFPVKIIRRENKENAYTSRNLGVSQSKGEILFFTDADCVYEKDLLKKIEKAFFNDKIDAIQGSGNLTKQKNLWVYGECARLTMTSKDFWGDTKNFVVRKSVFNEFNGFDDRLATGADSEFVYRLRRSKKKVLYSKDLKVYHWWPEDPIFLVKKSMGYAHGDFLFERKMGMDYVKLKLKFICRSMKWSYLRRFNYLNSLKDRIFSRFEKLVIFLYIFFITNLRSLTTIFWFYKHYRPR